MSNAELEVRERQPNVPAPIMSDQEIHRTWRVAAALAKSGMFKDAQQAAQAFAKILIGRDLGLSPTQAMTGIHIIEGRPELSAALLASFVKQRPGYDYEVREMSDKACELEFSYRGQALGTSRFTIEDAEQAKLAKKDTYVKYPRNMLFARAMSNGVGWFCPEVTGGLRVYVEGEIPERHQIVDAEVEPELDMAEALKNVPRRDEVVAVIERARELGHVGISDVPTAEMVLHEATEERVVNWLAGASRELDALAASLAEEPPDAVVVDGETSDDHEGEPSGDNESGAGSDEEPAPVPAEGPEAREGAEEAGALRREAESLEVQADSMLGEDQDRVDELNQEAEKLRRQADRLDPPDEQETLGV